MYAASGYGKIKLCIKIYFKLFTTLETENECEFAQRKGWTSLANSTA